MKNMFKERLILMKVGKFSNANANETKLKLNVPEINEFADMTADEISDTKLGEIESPEDEPAARIVGGHKFYLGMIHDEGENTPKEIEELDEIYSAIDRETLPESYDSRAKGKV